MFTTYAYDANGIRAKKVEDGATTHYLALGHQVMYEKTGAVGTRHIFVGSQRIAEVRGPTTSYFHNDYLGSPRVVTDASGVPGSSMATKPFGEPHAGSAQTSYGFTGKDLDSTGLYYFAARYYDPTVGRFVTEDTWEGRFHQPASQNRYVYVLNNPLRYVDPTGHWDVDLICSGGGAAALAGAAPYVNPGAAIKSLAQGLYYAGVHIVAGIYQGVVHNAAAIVDAFSGGSNNAGQASGGSGGNSASPDPGDFGKTKQTMRERLLESVDNMRLKDAVNQMYRPGGSIGDGGLADAIRHEISAGGLIGGKSHLLKGYERLRSLERIICTEILSPSDLWVALRLVNDLRHALGGPQR